MTSRVTTTTNSLESKNETTTNSLESETRMVVSLKSTTWYPKQPFFILLFQLDDESKPLLGKWLEITKQPFLKVDVSGTRQELQVFQNNEMFVFENLQGIFYCHFFLNGRFHGIPR